ncbi:multidrug effflux MFS transporter [Aestuariispira insulae]|uniref:Bcr/CflA family efflux transporter n=1 Tax=Aestuariispira insulae TaxID=1461337 RepID=A0A3D9HXB9_9PROT|nr:multidrug effflux MFS transporter [Aestuariispira insulae]RED54148.1 DHA1 family bicyclomycin/chloramphenicol resistance-like MFS transporter [Aestuariispira insulae]
MKIQLSGASWIIPALLMMASATSILATDLYAPSLPHLPEFFQTDNDMVKLTMSLNVMGYAVAQLFYGPLADRFGRRPVMLAGMAGFILFSLACALADSIEFLIAARVLQGLTACAEAVVALLVIRDLYDEDDSVKLMGFYGMTISLAPAVGPIIGGYVHVWLGWRANFYLLTGLALVVTALILIYLPETGTREKGAARPGRILRDYTKLLCCREYLSYAIPLGAVMGGLFAFITEAPFVLIDLMGVPTQSFGYYQAVIVVAYFLGSLAASGAVKKVGVEKLTQGGLCLVAGGGILLMMMARLIDLTPMLIAGGMTIFAIGLGLVFASAPIRAMDCAPTGRGPSAAMLGALEMGGAGLGSLTVGLLNDGTDWPLAVGVGGFSLVALLLYLGLRGGDTRQLSST